ncbi:hypothetical protein I552_3732 [Mycobacterium xenopi 3993]|nr:hypothetical protein I552_3732 [Mycobacterium xenopi 3993]
MSRTPDHQNPTTAISGTITLTLTGTLASGVGQSGSLATEFQSRSRRPRLASRIPNPPTSSTHQLTSV